MSRYIPVTFISLYSSVMHLSQVIAKVSRLDVLRREMISGLFFEMVEEFITTDLLDFNPQLHVMPLPGRDELEVTCQFGNPTRPIYLCAVKNSNHAKLATIAFLELQRANLPFKGYVVHDDIEALPAKDRKRITSAADKQFISLDDFRENARKVLLRDVA